MSLTIEYYSGNATEWDSFVLKKSMNGTFLQTRRFIEYHNPKRFKDCSICIRKGQELVAVILACEIEENREKCFFAHRGTTFGGITISPQIYSSSSMHEMMILLENFLKEENFTKVFLKMVPTIYQKESCDLIDYFLYKMGYKSYSELNFFMKLDRYKEDVLSQYSSGKRRDYRYSLKNNLVFRPIDTKDEIAEYYQVMLKNMGKLGLTPVHSLEDLFDLKLERFPSRIRFYAVYYEKRIIAGSMIFCFDKRIWHTQYLSSDEEYLSLFPMEFLITNLIYVALEEDAKCFSFGICTEDMGKYLNLGLSRFKEGFGAEYCINYSYEKGLCD